MDLLIQSGGQATFNCPTTARYEIRYLTTGPTASAVRLVYYDKREFDPSQGAELVKNCAVANRKTVLVASSSLAVCHIENAQNGDFVDVGGVPFGIVKSASYKNYYDEVNEKLINSENKHFSCFLSRD